MISALSHFDTQWVVLPRLMGWWGWGAWTENYAPTCMNAHGKTGTNEETPLGLYRLTIWTRLVCVTDSVCVCVCDGFSRCCAVSCSSTSNERQRCSGAAQGHAAPLMLTLLALYVWYSHCSCMCSHPRLNVKTHVGLFPRRNKTAHTAGKLYPVGADLRLTDGVAVTHIYLLFSFTTHTHTHAGKWMQRGVFHGQTVSVARLLISVLLVGKQISTITYGIKPSAGCKQQADRSPTWPHVTVSEKLYSVHQSGGGQRSLTCFLLITSLVLYLPTADWPELCLNPEASSSEAPTDRIKLTD